MDQAKLFLSSFGGPAPDPNDPGDPIGQSLRFRNTGPAYLTNTSLVGASLGSYTVSLWVKRGFTSDNTAKYLLTSGSAGTNTDSVSYNLDGLTPAFVFRTAGGAASPGDSGILHRDPSAWYHIVCVYDQTAQTATIYINGEQQAQGSATGTPTLFNESPVQIGLYADASYKDSAWEGYVADYFFIDGQALEPTVFGRENVNGVWVPVTPTGLTFGSNGFHLDFSDPNDIGADRSPNGNHFTPTGFNTTYPGLWSNDVTTNKSWNDPLVPYTAGEADYIWLGNCSSGDCDDATYVFEPASPIYLNGNTLRLGTGGTSYLQTKYKFTFNDGSEVELDWQASASNATTFQDVKTGDFSLVKMEMIYDGPYSTGANHGGWTGLWLGDNKLVDYTGEDYDVMQDSPTQNYATLNAANANIVAPLDANLTASVATTNAPSTIAMPPNSGQYYFEAGPYTVTTSSGRGIGLLSLERAITGWGIFTPQVGNWSAYTSNTSSVQINDGDAGTSTTPAGSFFNTGDVLQIAYDSDTGNAWLGINNTFFSNTMTATTVGGANPTFTGIATEVFGTAYVDTTADTLPINFGQKPFLYQAPEGFQALQTQNLPKPTIPNGRDHFQAITGPGNGADGTVVPGQRNGNFSQYLTNENGSWSAGTPGTNAFDGNTETNATIGGFNSSGQPWYQTFAPVPALTYSSSVEIYTKNTNNTAELNGVSTPMQLNSWTTIATGSGEISAANPLTLTANDSHAVWFNALRVDGEILVDFGILPQAQNTFPDGVWWIKDRVNTNNHQLVDSVRGGDFVLRPNTAESETSYIAPTGDSVAWCWKAGESSVTDNTGSLESQVCVNEEAGFSIVQWTGSGGFDSIGHGLGRRPGMVITRTRQGDHWIVGIDGFTTLSGGGSPSQWLNSDSFVGTNWANGLILNSSNAATEYVASSGINVSGNSMIAYVWVPIDGYSAFGSFQGNSSTEGPFIHLGFRPAFFMWKRADGTGNWEMRDTTRHTTNPDAYTIYANRDFGEAGPDPLQRIDILSNGVKIRNSQSNMNQGTLIYCAFAENPFQTPVTAR